MILQPVDQWNILDSTKIQCYMDCPRRYFYSYILGWQKAEPNVHLVFGEAWHKAMETLLTYGFSADALVLAQMNLEEIYRKSFSPTTDDLRYPKTPGFAADMLVRYIQEYANDLLEFEVLYTEVSGSVNITNSRSVHFKTDSILRGKKGFLKDKVFSLEHKTTTSISRPWVQQWGLKTQVGVYAHVLNCLFDPRDVYGVIINAAIFQKTKPGFSRFHEPRTRDQMAVWLATIQHWIDRIEFDTATLIEAANDLQDDILRPFPLNSESCTKYFGCEYYQFCTSWYNPLLHLEEIPIGYEVRHWDPTKIETTNKIEI